MTTGQFQLTDDQLAIQEMAQRFTADNITPFAAEWDEQHHFPRDVIRQTAELGFGAITGCPGSMGTEKRATDRPCTKPCAGFSMN